MDFKKGDRFFDYVGILELTMVDDNFYKYCRFKNNDVNSEKIHCHIGFRLERLKYSIQNKETIPYTKASWLLYGKKKV